MRFSGRSALALAALLIPLACTSSTDRNAGEASATDAAGGTSADAAGRTPADLVAVWIGMWNSYDLDRVTDLFLADDRLTYFSSEFEGVIRGFDAVVEHHRGFGFTPGGADRGTRLWVEGSTESRFGPAAVLTAIWYFAGADTESSPQRGPVTFVCVLEGGEWRFAHMNFGNYPETEVPEEG